MARRGQQQRVPYDERAEIALLGNLILRPSNMDEISRTITPADFYKPSHAHIYSAISELWHRGAEKIDAVVIADVLKTHGLLEAIGGPATLVHLQSEAPSTALTSAQRYSEIILRMSTYRSALRVAENLRIAAYDMRDDPNDIIDSAKAELEAIGIHLGEMPPDTYILDEYLSRPQHERPGWVIPGLLRSGWRVMVVAAEGVGKALALDTPIPSPDGWTTMGNLRPGHRLFDLNGEICTVTFATEVQLGRSCYEVEFSDGSVIVADADHQWLTHTANEREKRKAPATRTTTEILETLRVRSGNVANHSIPTCGPLQYESSTLPIDPYLLGIWLGDGASRGAAISTADEEILQAFRDGGFVVTHDSNNDYRIAGEGKWDRSLSFESALRGLSLIQNKHIPALYLMASVKDRISLLQGLMDSNGSIGLNGRCEFSVTSEVLATQTMELIVGLGHKATINDGRVVSRRWRITFMPTVQTFRLTRKLCRQIVASTRASTRYITDVRPVPSVPVKCVQVDSPSHTYLAGRSCIPTHNTVLFRQMAILAAQGLHPLHFGQIDPVRTLIVDLENPEDSVMDVCIPINEKVKARVRDSYTPDRAWLWHRPAGINLRSRPDRIALETVISRTQPQLVCLGPLYKAYEVNAHENDELAAREIMAVFDDLRTRYGFGLMLEHHAPKETAGTKRKLMPYGSSLWLRWPEIGINLYPGESGISTLTVGRWRGDRLENEWPISISRSEGFPWAGTWETGHFSNNAESSSVLRHDAIAEPVDESLTPLSPEDRDEPPPDEPDDRWADVDPHDQF